MTNHDDKANGNGDDLFMPEDGFETDTVSLAEYATAITLDPQIDPATVEPHLKDKKRIQRAQHKGPAYAASSNVRAAVRAVMKTLDPTAYAQFLAIRDTGDDPEMVRAKRAIVFLFARFIEHTYVSKSKSKSS